MTDSIVILLPGEIFERSYLGNLSAIQLNGYYAAALFEGKVELHVVSIIHYFVSIAVGIYTSTCICLSSTD